MRTKRLMNFLRRIFEKLETKEQKRRNARVCAVADKLVSIFSKEEITNGRAFNQQLSRADYST